MRKKAAAAGIITLIASATALVLYAPLPVTEPRAPAVRVPVGAPLLAVRTADVPTGRRAPTMPARRKIIAVYRQVAASDVDVDPLPRVLDARSWADTALLNAAPPSDRPAYTPPQPRAAVSAAGRVVGGAFARAGRQIGSAFQRRF